MNNACSLIRRVIVCPFAIGCLAVTWHVACAAPPIKTVFEECAVEQLTWNESASLDAGCTNAACADAVCAITAHDAPACRCHTCGRDVCCPTVEEVTEEKTCWNVKGEKVCIPAVRWPWEPGGSRLTLFSWLCGPDKNGSCGSGPACGGGIDCAESCADCRDAADCSYPAKCGRVRSICVLEPESYEVTTCQCKWEIRRLPCCCGAEACAGGCAGAVGPPAYEADPAIEGVLPIPAPMP